MKFSLNFLNNFIDLSEFFNKQNELADKLSFRGFEIEKWEEEQFPHLLIAEVKEKKAHPSADRLSLCQIHSGAGRMHSIVCGAMNFQEGDKVVLALPKAVLPGPFEIKTRKIRGEISEGMLVSLSELELATPEEKEDGIFILPKEAEVGADFASYAGLNDTIFDINISPNRADCLSHFGMARELSCILNQELKTNILQNMKKEEKQFPTDHFLQSPQAAFSGPSIQKHLGLQIKQPKLCTRYTGRAVYGVKVKPSPLWLKVYLKKLDFKFINNIVDITNYSLIQWGQPLHAFDLDLLQEKIIVDFSKKDEKFQTLDNQELQLTGTELCIRDTKRPLALAGIIGGIQSGIHPNTKNIFIESACFEPSQIRRTSKKFNIETDSSYRFSRGVSSESTLEILHKSVALIQKLAGGEISKDKYDFWEKPIKAKPIEIQKEDLKRRLGMELSFEKFQKWMERLNCQVQVKKEKTKILPPFFRFDLNIKEDLIEEYARLEGYDKIPEKISYLSDFPKPDQKEYDLFLRIARILAHEGFYQAINHSFISQKFSSSFLNTENNLSINDDKISSFLWSPLEAEREKIYPVFLQNPLSMEYNMMRISLIPSLFKNVQQSIRHGCSQGRIFEVGKVFATLEKKENIYSHSPTQDIQMQNDKTRSPYKEDSRLGFIAWGQEENLWEKNKNRPCVYDLKTALNTLLELLHISDYEWISGEQAPPFIHPFQYMILKVQDKNVAYIGSLNPLYAENYKIRMNMALAEMNTQFLVNQNPIKQAFQNLSPFPVVERDLSFLVPKDFPAEKIIKKIKKLTGLVCRTVKVFDIYENKQTTQEGVRSIAFRLTLQSNEHTLTEEGLKKLQDKLTKELTSQYPVKLR